MTMSDWLAQAKRDETRLTALLRAYHPAAPGEKRELPITAGRTEAFAQRVRQRIAAAAPYDPVATFQSALAADNVTIVTRLLNEAWFGVPESTDCWSVPGFSEAVALLEDPPDE